LGEFGDQNKILHHRTRTQELQGFGDYDDDITPKLHKLYYNEDESKPRKLRFECF